MDIKIENMTNPPEKMKLMFEAVSAFIKEQRELSLLKVSEITSRAGIGKGTAYEYFASKEELIANALLYEYSQKMTVLIQLAFEPEDFKSRCLRVMDWIRENKEYNRMFSGLLTSNFNMFPGICGGDEVQPFETELQDFLFGVIDRFMEEGYRMGAFTEKDPGMRSLAFLTSMVEYSFVVMGPRAKRYEYVSDEELREFIYRSLIKSLR